MKEKNLQNNLNELLRHIDSINETMPMTTLLLKPFQKKAHEKFRKFMEEKVEEIKNENGDKSFTVKHEDYQTFSSLSKNSEISSLAPKIIIESLFVSLVSQFDAFLGRLLKIIFEIRPELISRSERSLSYSELVEFDSIDKAKEYIIDKEIESVLRKSHSEHFDYLENKLSMELRKDLPIWKNFVELTERRNLFVHCDGFVSSQYLKVCKLNEISTKDIELNQRLTIDIEYFNDSYQCIYELSVKLTHTLWRKLQKINLKDADNYLNSICYELICSGQSKLAYILLEFACKQKKFHNEEIKNIFLVNKALSKYLGNSLGEAKEIISSKDWSASSDDFKLAEFIIKEDFEECYKLMKAIGVEGKVSKQEYKTWPLFYGIRKEKKFKKVFNEIFQEEYKVSEIPKKPVQELIEKEIKSNPELRKRLKTNK